MNLPNKTSYQCVTTNDCILAGVHSKDQVTMLNKTSKFAKPLSIVFIQGLPITPLVAFRIRVLIISVTVLIVILIQIIANGANINLHGLVVGFIMTGSIGFV
jgi:hypothetical protein